MTVGVLLICHAGIGAALAQTAREMLPDLPLPLRVLDVPQDSDPERTFELARDLVKEIDDGSGVLILTDLFGATPCNIAGRLQADHNVHMVTGLNLPMLIRTLNYPQLPLKELVVKARSGGMDGIIDGECR